MSEGGVCIVKRRWRVAGVAWLLFASKALAPVFFLARARSGPPHPPSSVLDVGAPATALCVRVV